MRVTLQPFGLIGLVGLMALAGAGSAGAAAPPGREVDVGLSYQPADGCPSRNVVVEQLGIRGLRVTAAGAERSLSMDVASGATDGPRFKGKLTIDAANGRPALAQTVSGQDCRAVMLSLTLVAALAVNPSPPSPPSPPSADAEPEKSPEATVAAVKRPVDDLSNGRPTWLVGASGRGMSALGAGPAVGLSLFVERLWGERPGRIASLIFSATTAAPPTMTLASGSADLRAYLGRGAACWFGGILAADPVFVSPCAGIEAGALQGTGNINRPRTATRPWVTPLVSARAVAQLTRSIWVSLEGSVFSPLVRDTFLFDDPRATIHRSPVVGGGVELGLAGAFW